MTPHGDEFVGAGAGLYRAAHERAEDGLVDRLRGDAATRVLAVHGDRAPLVGGGRPALQFVSPEDVDAPAWAFLGRDSSGRAVLAAALPAAADAPFEAPGGWAGLRQIGGDLPADDAGAFLEALSLGRWLLDAPHCPACGALAEVRNGGWSRRCPVCGREHFPRTDPAVIVAITSADDPDALLLGSNVLWDNGRFSCFAGFAEAGESLESAVVREVREEAGVEVSDLRYRGSQAWPYPRSLMAWFLATAREDAAARPDGDEIAAVRWFTRAQIGAALAGEGGIILPGRASIAHRLIAEWHADVG